MQKDKSSTINIFEVKPIKKDFSYKISAADVFNQFLYVGDQKGTIYSYPIRVTDNQIIPKSTQQQSKSITKSKIDKIVCYRPISNLIVLSDEKLFTIDTALKKPQVLVAKVHDFAINQPYVKEGGLFSIVIITRKKQGMIFFYHPTLKKFQDTKNRFQIAQLPTCVGYTGNFINLSYKKDYESLNIEKSFAVKKGPLQAKSPFLKVTGVSQVLFFSDQIGIFMEPEFLPKQKDNIFVNRPILNISQCGNYCLILCDNLLQVYSTFDPKKFTLIQQIPFNSVKGITNERPFIFGRQQMYFLYEVPYETQIKSLLQKCRVDDAIYLLIQNVGADNQKKIQQLKMNAVWPLIKRMQFVKAKQILFDIQFDVRQLILLFPQLISLDIESMKSRADKSMSTMILQFINQKVNKGKDEETDLKRQAKIFLKEVLQNRRDFYVSKMSMIKVKMQFNSSKYSLIKPKLSSATTQQLLQIIDFTLIKWFLEMGYFKQLEQFFLNNPTIYCKRLFSELQDTVKNNPKLVQFPTLKPRLYTAFDKIDEAYEGWKIVAENNSKQSLVKVACEQAVKLLTQFQDRHQVLTKLNWILKKNPQAGMGLFKMVDLSFLQPDQIIKNFQQEKSDRYLELYLEIIVLDKKTEIQAYHTKLLLLYIENLFKIHPKDNKQQAKTTQFQEKLMKMRKLLKNPEAKYASQPILKKIQKCEWLMEDQIFLYAREKRHQDALRKYISKNMSADAEQYCKQNRDKTLTIYFKMLLTMFKSFESSKNNSSLLLKKDIILFLKKYSSDSELDPIIVLDLIPQNWMLNDYEGVGGIYQFLESAIIHTLHQKRTAYTSKHLSQMDLLNSQFNLIQAKRAYLRFTYKKKCLKCDMPIADKFFVVYPNANVFHQSCAKNYKNTVCPKTNQDFQKTFKY